MGGKDTRRHSPAVSVTWLAGRQRIAAERRRIAAHVRRVQKAARIKPDAELIAEFLARGGTVERVTIARDDQRGERG